MGWVEGRSVFAVAEAALTKYCQSEIESKQINKQPTDE